MGPEVLNSILRYIPKKYDENLLVGYDGADDAAVYKLTDDIAIVQTLDFFTPVVEDPYMFGRIAAANALSDIYAMGGKVISALNIVAYPENADPAPLGAILKGGAEKVHEAGGVLAGGHSVNDPLPKYGLSVTGIVHPQKLIKNNGCRQGDKIILTKPLGVGIVLTAWNMGEADKTTYMAAVRHMETLNKYAADMMLQYDVHGCTDVTGFGFLGHLHEMVPKGKSIHVAWENVPFIPAAYDYAKEFFITGAGQKNRNHLKGKVMMRTSDFAIQEILYDPQTSGGLLISVSEGEAEALVKALTGSGINAAIVGEVLPFSNYDIIVD